MSGILITGANGFLGRALSDRLSAEGGDLFRLDIEQGDIAEPAVFDSYNDVDIHHVFHLAARTYVPDSWEHPYEFYHTNVLGTANVLEFCKRKKAGLTYISAYLYGQPDSLPISEDHPVRPNNPYAHSKYMAEQLCGFYAKHHQVNVTVVRPFNIYGPGQSDRFLIPHIVHQALHYSCIKVKDLAPRRDYVYIEDVIDALLRTMHPHTDLAIFNIGAGFSMSVKEIIDVVQELVQTNKPIESEDIVRQNELPDVVADISKARQDLHWSPAHSFREGLTKTIRLLREC